MATDSRMDHVRSRATIIAVLEACLESPVRHIPRSEPVDPAGIEGDREIRDLLDALVTAPEPDDGLTALFDSGIGEILLPEVAALGMDQGGRKLHKTNLAHSIRVCGQGRVGAGTVVLPAPVEDALGLLRWSCLLHDVGKAVTRKIAEGPSGVKVTFHDHELVGAKLARARLKALGFPRPFADDVAKLVHISGRPHGFDGTWTDAAVRRFMTDSGRLIDVALDLARADCTSKHEHRRQRVAASVDAIACRAREVMELDARRTLRPALNGDEIMAELNIGPGTAVGDAYRFLRSFAEQGVVLTKDQAADRLRAWWQRRAGSTG